MKQFYLIAISLLSSIVVFGQLSAPEAVTSNQPVNWGSIHKSATDSCGTYYNNYIGLGKTSSIRIERLRTGNATESGQYNGRAQKFSAPQPIEVSGIEFYSFIDNNTSVDSLMVITTLNNYDTTNDTIGAELARDTVYVFHNSFNPVTDPLPSIAVQSEFSAPIVVSSEYMITVFTPTDDSLRIIANEPSVNDGDGEGLGFALYDNINYPSFQGWYDMLNDFSFDYDFLISPKISYLKTTNFVLSDSVLCPNASPVCLTYNPAPVQFLRQYNRSFNNLQDNMQINWGDGTNENDTMFACHSFPTAGSYNINFIDTLKKWDLQNPYCNVDLSKNLIVNDSLDISFTYVTNGFTVDFTTTATNVDSVWWDFGDNAIGSADFNPSHTYPGFGTYNVWLYAFNGCLTKSIFTTITIQTNNITENNKLDFTFFPNPATDFIIVKGTSEKFNVSIYNIAGKTVFSGKNMSDLNKIDVSKLTNGTYFIRLESANETITKKLAIKH